MGDFAATAACGANFMSSAKMMALWTGKIILDESHICLLFNKNAMEFIVFLLSVY